MFTGIILGKGTIIERRSSGNGMIFKMESDFDLTDPEEGESIAVNGVCLTAKKLVGRRFSVDVSPESLSRTEVCSFRRLLYLLSFSCIERSFALYSFSLRESS